MMKDSRALNKGGAQPSLCDQEALHGQGAVVSIAVSLDIWLISYPGLKILGWC